jgi:hypothetical protein
MFASLSIWSSSTFAACNIVTSGIVGCYTFDDGNVQDGSGNGNHGTAAAGVSYVKGKVGQALKLNGTGTSYARITNPAQKFDREYTLSAWVSTAGQGMPIVSKYSWNNTTGRGFLAFTTTPDGNSGVYSSGSTVFEATLLNTGWYPAQYPSYTLPLNEFHLVTITYNVGRTKIYIDGQFTVEKTISHTSSLDNPYDILIGSYLYNNGTALVATGYNRTFDGLIDELRIYNRAITDAEITQLYNEANPKPVVCAPANYTNGVLKVPFITIDGVTDAYKATMLQYNSGFAFRVTESAVITGKSSCPATYSPTTGILHIPLVKTKSAIPLNTFQCYDVTLQAFSDRFQLDLDTLKVVNCP